MKMNSFKIIRQCLSALLTVIFIFSIVQFTPALVGESPVSGYDPLSNGAGMSYLNIFNKLASPETNNAVDYFLPSTLENGRLWTDKTVSEDRVVLYDIAGKPIGGIDAKANEFLITLSALSQSYTVDTVVEPTDTVFVLDVSASMYINKLDTGKSRVEVMVEALNDAIQILMDGNPNNRIAVVAFGGDSGKSRIVPILKLGHYNVHDGNYFSMKSAAYIQVSSQIPDSALFDKANRLIRVFGGTPTQHGIYAGAQILLNNDDTYYTDTEKGITVTRKPNIVLLSDGGATLGWTDYKFENPGSDNENGFDCGDANNTDMGIAVLTVLTAAYCKQQVHDHYYGPEETAKTVGFYTIGLGLKGTGFEAPAVLDPINNADKVSRVYLKNTYNMKEILDDFINLGSEIEFPALNKNASSARGLVKVKNDGGYIKNYDYTEGYYPANEAKDLSNAFNSIAQRIISTGNYVTKVGSGDADFDGYLVFSDVLGEYMEYKSSEGLWYDNNMYTGYLFAQSMTSDDQDYREKFLTAMMEHQNYFEETNRTFAQEKAESLLDSCIAAGKANDGLYYNSPTDFSNKIKYYANDKRKYVGNYFDDSGIPVDPIPAGAKCVVELYTMEGMVQDPVSGELTDLMGVAIHVVTALEEGEFECVFSDGSNNLVRNLKAGQQVVRWYIPASLIPIRTVTEKDGAVQVKEAIPMRYIYSVGLRGGLALSDVSDDYKNKTANKGQNSYYFYTNVWDDPNNLSKAFFQPNENNPYYQNVEDIEVQILLNNGRFEIPYTEICAVKDWYLLLLDNTLIKPEYVQLYANGVPMVEPVLMVPDGNLECEYTWKELLLYELEPDANGNAVFINYTVAEGTWYGSAFTPYDLDSNNPGFAVYYFQPEWNERRGYWEDAYIINYDYESFDMAFLTIEKKVEGDIPVWEPRVTYIEFEVFNSSNARVASKIYPRDFTVDKCYVTLPTAGTYTVKETGYGALSGYECETVITEDYTNNTVNGDEIELTNVQAGKTVNVTFTNTYTDKNVADLTIKKTFAGEALNSVPDDIYFEIVGDNYSNTVYYGDFVNGELTLERLKPGTYTVTELGGEVSGYHLSGHLPKTETLAAGDNTTVHFENYYTKNGTLTIEKEITGLSEPPDDIIFYVVSDDMSYERYIEYSELDGDGKYVLQDLLPGEYTVTETGGEVPGYDMTKNLPDGDSFRITGTNFDIEVIFENTYEAHENPRSATLTINKIFYLINAVGLDAENYLDLRFDILGLNGSYSKTIYYSDFVNGEYVIDSLIPGLYTIIESGGAIDGYKFEVNHEDGYTLELNYDDDETVIFANTYTKLPADEEPASLTIKKIFVGLESEKYPNVLFNITGANFMAMVSYSNFKDGEYTFNNFPTGPFTVTESGAEVEGYSCDTVKLVEGDTVTFINTYTKIGIDIPDPILTASLTIEKIFKGITKYPNVSFNVVGKDIIGVIIYSKTIYYNDFVNGQYTINHLAPGTYTVTESDASVLGYMLIVNPASGHTLQLNYNDEKTITFVNNYIFIPSVVVGNGPILGGGLTIIPDMKIEKILADDQPVVVKPGMDVRYVIRVTNTGNVELINIKVTDVMEGNTYDIGLIDSLLPNQSEEFTFTYNVPADTKPGKVIRNTAIAEQQKVGKKSDYADITVSVFIE
ncbi:MAG: DUF5979 domain-containing protein [Oscillospiraceae bacterium]|nr:DUF5979 domain-containing protein [Oscillospiraceae bacterium]